jgi:hypothetical protein
VNNTLKSETKYKQKVEEKTKNVCNNGHCVTGSSEPTVRLFDGRRQVEFVETDNGLSFRVDGGKKSYSAIEVEHCDVDNKPRQCREYLGDVLNLDDDLKWTLSQDTPVKDYYRLKSDQHDYLVKNVVSVAATDDPDSMKGKCASVLCDVNSSECPAPYCVRDGNTCKPDNSQVDAVELK